MVITGRLAEGSSAPAVGETFTELVTTGNVTIEAIHSSSTPDPGWYRQDHDEWVMVIDGRAELEVAGRVVAMGAGDWILIRSGVGHRVVATATGTRWLAVRVNSDGSGSTTGTGTDVR